MLQTQLPQPFIVAINRDLAYWSQQFTTSKDDENQRLLPALSDMLMTVQFGISSPVTHLATSHLLQSAYNLIERQKQSAQWLPVFDQLINSAEIAKTPDTLATLQFRKASLLRHNEQVDAAAALLQSLCEDCNNEPLRAKLLLELSECQRMQGEFNQAIVYGKQALTIFKHLEDDLWIASAFNNLGISATELHQLEEAAHYLQQAYTIEQEIGDASRLLTVLINLGRLAEFQQNVPSAIDYYNEALTYAAQATKINDAILVRVNLGNLYNQSGDCAQAKTQLLLAEQALEKHKSFHRTRMLMALNMSVTHFMQANYAETIRYAQQSAEIAQRLNLTAMQARATMNVASAHITLANFQQAATFIGMASRLLKEAPHTPWVSALKEELHQQCEEAKAGIDTVSADTHPSITSN